MKVTVQWFDGSSPNFNVMIASGDGKDPFITVKGCRIAAGRNGEFVSWPSRKKEDNTYWNHIYASDAFNAHVLEIAKATQPAQDTRTQGQRRKDESWAAGSQRDDSAPF
jgi:DNA-binding cell septation regulator SpoVG